MFYPPARIPVRPTLRSRIKSRRAFTLVELLTVIAIIGVLTGITLTAVGGIRERAKVGQARAELSALSVALESYKRQYGNYPQLATPPATSAIVATAVTTSDTAAQFFNSIAGVRGPTGSTIPNGRAFTDLGKFTLEVLPGNPEEKEPYPTTKEVENAFLDPWGRRYLYYYIASSGGAPSKYVLYSVGPGDDDDENVQNGSPPSATGAVDYEADANLKHIYANR